MYANFNVRPVSRVATAIVAGFCAFTTISSAVAMLTLQALPA